MSKIDLVIKENKDQILKWIDEKKSKTWMAKELGCDRGSFRDGLKRNHIDYKGQQGGPDYSIQNKQYGNLIPIEPVKRNELTETQKKYRGVYWRCQCVKCNNFTIVKGTALRSGAIIGDGCERSKGELKIKNILNANNILYKKEYTFSDCIINKNPAKFDFAILNKDNSIKYLIEYDGKQHFEDCFGTWFESNENFEKRKNSDLIKNEYCLNKNIPLIRIPYTIYDILKLDDLILETSNYIIKKGDD